MPHDVSWETLDWSALDRMREGFLDPSPANRRTWASVSDVANYDFTFAQRIGWKWDAVLGELRARRWTPPCGQLLDWGCGSGIAARRVLEWFGAPHFKRVALFDRSPFALDFAVRRTRELFPETDVRAAHEKSGESEGAVGLLVVSHVLNELDARARSELRRLARRAEAVLWVEPGTNADSRALIAMREELRDQFTVVAPCTHQAACGMLAPANAPHWCHHHAFPPKGVLADSGWVRFGQRAGIDLRSLPYSFLVLERTGLRAPVPGLAPPDCARVLAGCRFYKGFARLVVCRGEGVRELELQKRTSPAHFKALRSGEGFPVWKLDVEGGRIRACEEAKTG